MAPSQAGGGLSFDDALTKYIGECGRSQIRILLLASMFWVGNGLLILLMCFHASPSPLKEHWWRCNDTADARCAEVFALADPTRTICELPRSSWSWTQPSKSIISQFDLVCGKAWQSQFANSGFFMGYLIGSGVFGGLSDSRGRKPVLFGCTALGALFTLLVGVAPNYVVYFLFRLVTGIGAAGQALTTYVLATESIGPKWRGIMGVVTQLFFVVGEFVLVLIAYLARPWRVLCFACAAFNAVLLLLWPTLPESPRWLLVRGRREEATAILERIAAGNGRAMPPEPLADSTGGAAGTDGAAAAATAAEEGTPLKHPAAAPSSAAAASPAKPPSLTSMLLRDRHMLRRFLVLAYVWCVICMAYYGISLALGGLPGSIYVIFMVTSAAEIPANVLAAWMIERYGRHNTMAGGMLLGGAACLACAFVPAGVASSLLAAVGKFGCAGAFTVASIFTSEMFPTLVRSAVLGAENEAARVGGIAAPFIVLVGQSTGQAAMPFIIFGVASLVAAVAILSLPETLGTRLPDTMADMAGIQSIFTTRPWRRGGLRQTLREMFRARGGPDPSARPTPGATPAKDAAGTSVSTRHHHPRSATAVAVHASSGGGASGDGGAAELHRVLGPEEADMEVQVIGRSGGAAHPAAAAAASASHGYRPMGHGDGDGADGYGEDERHALLHSATARSDLGHHHNAHESHHHHHHHDHSALAQLQRHARSEGLELAAPRGGHGGGGAGEGRHGHGAQAYYEQRGEEARRAH